MQDMEALSPINTPDVTSSQSTPHPWPRMLKKIFKEKNAKNMSLLPGEQSPVPAGRGLRLDSPAQAPQISQGCRRVLNLSGVILNWRQF